MTRYSPIWKETIEKIAARGREVRADLVAPVDESTPSYHVEHLATFAIGRQHSLLNPADGIR